MSRFDTRSFWVKLRCGRWVVAERRHSHRWFICGDGCIKSYSFLSPEKGSIVEIGEEIIRNETYTEDKNNMKDTIKAVNKKIEELRKELQKHTDALEALQGICTHEWEDDGHDSHHNYSKCKICGKRSQD